MVFSTTSFETPPLHGVLQLSGTLAVFSLRLVSLWPVFLLDRRPPVKKSKNHGKTRPVTFTVTKPRLAFLDGGTPLRHKRSDIPGLKTLLHSSDKRDNTLTRRIAQLTLARHHPLAGSFFLRLGLAVTALRPTPITDIVTEDVYGVTFLAKPA